MNHVTNNIYVKADILYLAPWAYTNKQNKNVILHSMALSKAVISEGTVF